MQNKKLITIFIILSAICLLLIFTGIFFRVSEVEVYCYNVNDRDFDSRVESAADLKGTSVFLLNEQKKIDAIQQSVLDAKIVNIEVKFPNRVVINVVKKIRFAYIFLNDRYIILDNDLKILEETTTEPIELIRLDIEPSFLTSSNVGSHLSTKDERTELMLLSILNALERIDYREFDAIALIDCIEVDFSNEFIYLFTTSGATIELSGFNRILDKTRASIALFTELEDFERKTGMIKVYESGSELKASYLESDNR